jgi:D-glycero-D-manno-heptose 1,7-bisphosphate phosphatase
MSDSFDNRTIQLVIFDADGTLRRTTVPGQPCPNGPDEWEVMPNVRKTLLRVLVTAPRFGEWEMVRGIGVASNQGGVGLGYLTAEMAAGLLGDLVAAVYPVMDREAFGRVRARVIMCPHAPDAGCGCRKPQPGMLWWLMGHYGAAPPTTLYVGDMESDQEAASYAGCHFMWAKDFFGWPDR